VLELHYWEELDTAEIARVLDIPRGTVKTRLLRARTRLRDALLPRIAAQEAVDGLARALGEKMLEP
jgi:DNA-directed RNA polymerase specialized sigma24 family protein